MTCDDVAYGQVRWGVLLGCGVCLRLRRPPESYSQVACRPLESYSPVRSWPGSGGCLRKGDTSRLVSGGDMATTGTRDSTCRLAWMPTTTTGEQESTGGETTTTTGDRAATGQTAPLRPGRRRLDPGPQTHHDRTGGDDTEGMREARQDRQANSIARYLDIGISRLSHRRHRRTERDSREHRKNNRKAQARRRATKERQSNSEGMQGISIRIHYV